MDRENLVHYLNALDIRVDRQQSRENKIVAFCPFAPFKHKNKIDTRPSFAAFVNNEGVSGFVCMACRQKGTIHALIHRLGNLRGKDYSDLIEKVILSEEDGLSHFEEYESLMLGKALEVKPEPLDEALYHGIYPRAYEEPDGRDYLTSRRITAQTANELGLLYDDQERRVLFPVRGQDGRLYGFTGRSVVEGHPIKVKDYYGLPKRAVLLGGHRFRKGKPKLVVEGLFGYAHLHEMGLERVVDICALMGAVMTPEKAAILIENGDPVYILLDNDNGGELGTFGTGENGDYGAAGLLLGHVPLYVPVWPENKFDPDELTYEEVVDMLENTPPFTPADLC